MINRTKAVSDYHKQYIDMISIDQNSHSLWDTLPKLQAVIAAGGDITHYVEDIDVAFTQMGGRREGRQLQLSIARERFHPSGGQDWGAGLFYTEFLGRLPTEPRNYTPQLGAKISRVCKSTGMDIEEFYDTHATSDNYQLIGPSYISGKKDYHRVIGDLSIAEVREFLLEILSLAETDTLAKFPHPDSRSWTQQWFANERGRVKNLIAANPNGKLCELYRSWLASDDYLGDDVECVMTSQLFDLQIQDRRRDVLLEFFLRDYYAAGQRYNRAITESDVGLNELQTSTGELPFFAVMRRGKNLVRTHTFCDAGKLVIDGESFAPLPGGHLPIDKLREYGILSLPGKAVVLSLQVRMLDKPTPLILPDRGSLYIPATRRFESLLKESHLLPPATLENVAPIVRVRFNLLKRMASLPAEIVIHLPDHLAQPFGCEEIAASRFAECYEDVSAQAVARLDAFKQQQNRQNWIFANFPRESADLDALNRRRQQLASVNPKDPQIRRIHQEARLLQAKLQEKLVQQVFSDAQTAQLDYYNSRGAILPWANALGGKGFYEKIINNAVFAEDAEDAEDFQEGA